MFEVVDLNPCDQIGGKPVNMLLRYVGGGCSGSNNPQEGKATCSGNAGNTSPVNVVLSKDANGGGDVFFSGSVALNEDFTVSGSFGSQTYYTINNGQESGGFHTSCSKPLGVGDQFGSLLVVGLTGDKGTCGQGGTGSGGGDCCKQVNDKPQQLTMRFDGGGCNANNSQGDKFKCTGGLSPQFPATVQIKATKDFDGGGDVYFNGSVNLNSEFTINATGSEFPSKIFIRLNNGQEIIEMHTSCSAPLVSGDRFGSLTLLSLVTKSNETCGPPPPPPGGSCDDPTALMYTCKQTITIPCEIICPPDVKLDCDDSTDPKYTGEATLSCDLNECVEYVDEIVGMCPITIKRTWTIKIPIPRTPGDPGDPPGPPPVIPTGDCCDQIGGKPNSMILRYVGGGCSGSNNPQEGKATCSGNAGSTSPVNIKLSKDANGGGDIFFSGSVALNEDFTVTGSFGSQTYYTINNSQESGGFHTSCSKPLGVGDQFGSLLVVGLNGDKGTCGQGGTGSGGGDCCKQVNSKPRQLTMIYEGGGCNSSNQQGDKFNCTGGLSGSPSSVQIKATKDSDGGGDVYFNGTVTLGQTFDINATGSEFPSKIFIHLNNGAEKIEMHTSCSAPLVSGDRFGSLKLLSLVTKDNEICGPPIPPDDPTGCNNTLVTYNGDCNDGPDSFSPTVFGTCIGNVTDLVPTNGRDYASCDNGIICIATTHNSWEFSITARDQTTFDNLVADFLYPIHTPTAGGSSNGSSCPSTFSYDVKFYLNGSLKATVSGSVPSDQIVSTRISLPTPILAQPGQVLKVLIEGNPTSAGCDLFELAGLRVNGCCGDPGPPTCDDPDVKILTCVQMLEIEQPLPKITCPDLPTELSCDDSYTFIIPDAPYDNGEDGICAIRGQVPGVIIKRPPVCGGYMIIEYKGKDKCDRPMVPVQCTIRILPPPVPVITCPDLPLEISCDDAVDFPIPPASFSNGPSVTDSRCRITGTVQGKILEQPTLCGGLLIIEYSGKDECDRPIEAIQCTIKVLPPPLPTIVCPDYPDKITCDEAADFTVLKAKYSNKDKVTSPLCLIEGEVTGNIIEYPILCGGYLIIEYTGKDLCDRPMEAIRCSIMVLPPPIPVIECPVFEELTCDEAAAFVVPKAKYSNAGLIISPNCLLEGEVSGEIIERPEVCGGYLVIEYKGRDECLQPIEAVRCSIKVTPPPIPIIECPVFTDLTCDEAAAFLVPKAKYSNASLITSLDCLLEGEVSGEIVERPEVCGGYLVIEYKGTDKCDRPIEAVRCSIKVIPPPIPIIECPVFTDLTCDEAAAFVVPKAKYSNVSLITSLDCLLEGEVSGEIVERPEVCGGYLVIEYRGMDKCDRPIEAVRCSIKVIPPPIPIIECPVFTDLTCDEAAAFVVPKAKYSNVSLITSLDCLLEGEVSGEIVERPEVCGGYLVIEYKGRDKCDRPIEAVRCSIKVTPPPVPIIECPIFTPLTCDEAAVFQVPDADYSNGTLVVSPDCVLSGSVQGRIILEPGVCGGDLIIEYSGFDECGRPLVPVRCTIPVLPPPLPVIQCTALPPLTCEEAANFQVTGAIYSNDHLVTAAQCILRGTVPGVIVERPPICGGFLVIEYSGVDECDRPLVPVRCSIPVLPPPVPIIECPIFTPLTCDEAAVFQVPDADYSNGTLVGSPDCVLSGSVQGRIILEPGVCGGDLIIEYSGFDECGRPLVPVRCTIPVLPPPLPVIQCTALPPLTCEEAANFQVAGAIYSNDHLVTAAQCILRGTVPGVIVERPPICGGFLVIEYSGVDECDRPLVPVRCSIPVLPPPVPIIECPIFTPLTCDEAAVFQVPDADYSNGTLVGSPDCVLSGSVQGRIILEPGVCGGDLIIEYSGFDECGRPLVPVRCTIPVLPPPLPVIQCTALPPLTCEEAANFQVAGAIYSNDHLVTAAQCILRGTVPGVIVERPPVCGGFLVIEYSGFDECDRPLVPVRCSIPVLPPPVATITCPVFTPISCVDAVALRDSDLPVAKYDNGVLGFCNISGTVTGTIISKPTNNCGGEIIVEYSGLDECDRPLVPVRCTIPVLPPPIPTIVCPVFEPISCVDAVALTNADLPLANYDNGIPGFCNISGTVRGTIVSKPTSNCGGFIIVEYAGNDGCVTDNNEGRPLVPVRCTIPVLPPPVATITCPVFTPLSCVDAVALRDSDLPVANYDNGILGFCNINGTVRGKIISKPSSNCGGEIIVEYSGNDECDRPMVPVRCTIPVLPPPVATITCPVFTPISCVDAVALTDSDLPSAKYDNDIPGFCNISGTVRGKIISKPRSNCGGEIIVEYSGLDECDRPLVPVRCTIPVLPPPVATITCPVFTPISCVDAVALRDSDLPLANYDNGIPGFCNISGTVRGKIISKPTSNCGGEIIVEYSGLDECDRPIVPVRCTIPVLPPPVATITCPVFTPLSCVDAVALRDSDLPVANYDNGVLGFCNINGTVRGKIISKPSSNCGGEIIVEYSGNDECDRPMVPVRCTIPVLPPPVATITCPVFTPISCVDAVALTDSDLPSAKYDNDIPGFCNISGTVRGKIISKPTNNCGGEIIVEYSGFDECDRPLVPVRCTIPVLPPPVATITCPVFTPISCVDAVALTDSDLPLANYDNGIQGFCNINGTVRGKIISKPRSNCGGEIIVEYSGLDECDRPIVPVRCTIPVLPPPVATITCPVFTPLSCVDAVALRDSDLPVANYNNGIPGFCNISGTVRGKIISKPRSNCGGEIIVEYSGLDECDRPIVPVRCTIPVLPPPVATITCPVFTPISCVDAVALTDSDLPSAKYDNDIPGFCNISGTVRGKIISKPTNNCGGEIIVEYSGLDECDRPLVPVRCTIPVLPPPVATITCPVFTPISCVDAVALTDSDLPSANYDNGIQGFCNINGTVRGTIISKPSSNCGGEIIVEYSGLDECDRPIVPVRCTIPVLPPPVATITCPVFTPLSCVDAVALRDSDLPVANYNNGIPGFCNISGTVRGKIISKPRSNCGGEIIVEYSGLDECDRPIVPVRCTIPVLPPPVATITCPVFTPISCVDAVALTDSDLPRANYDNSVQGFCNISGTVTGTIISKPTNNCGGEIIVEYSGLDECDRPLVPVRCTIPVLPPPIPTIVCPVFEPISCVDAVALTNADLPLANYDNGIPGFCNISGTVRGTIVSKPTSNCGGFIIVEYAGNDGCVTDNNEGRPLVPVRCTIPVLPPPVATITCPVFTPISCVDAVALRDSDLPSANYDNGILGFCNINGTVRGKIISKPSSNCGGEIIVEYSGNDECDRPMVPVRCTIPVLPPPVATITCPVFTPISCVDAVALTDSDLPSANYDNGILGFCNINGTVRGKIISKPRSNCGGEIIVEYSGNDECDRPMVPVRCTIPVLPPPVATITCPVFTPISCVDAVALTDSDLPSANYDNGVQGFCNISGTVTGTIISKPTNNCGGEIIVEYSGLDECDRPIVPVRCTIPVLPPPVATITCPIFTPISCVDAVALVDADLPRANYDNNIQGFCNISGTVTGTIISKPTNNCGGEIIVEYSGLDECDRPLVPVRCTIPVLPPPIPEITCPVFTPLSCVDAVALTDADLPVANFDNGIPGFCNISGTVRGTIVSKPSSNCGGFIIVEYAGNDGCALNNNEGRPLVPVRCTIPVLPPPVATITCPVFTPISCVDAVALTDADLPRANYDNGVQGFCNISGTVTGTIISKPRSNCGGEIIVEYSGLDECDRPIVPVRCTIPVLPPPVATISCPVFTPISCVDAVALVDADLPRANYNNGVPGFCNISGTVTGTIISKPTNNCGGEIIVEYSGLDECDRPLVPVRCTIPVLPPPLPEITCPVFTPLSCVDAVALTDADLPLANFDNGIPGFCNIRGTVRGTIVSKPSSNCGGYIIVEYAGNDGCALDNNEGRPLVPVRCTIPVLPPPIATITCPVFTPISCVDAVALTDADLPRANYDNGVQGFCNISGTVTGTIISKPARNCGGEIIVEYRGTDECGRPLAPVQCRIPVLPPPLATITCPVFTPLSCVDAVALRDSDLPVANYDNGVLGFCNISGTVRGTIISKPSNNCGGEIIVEYSGTDECGRALAAVRCTIPVLPPPVATITCPSFTPLSCVDAVALTDSDLPVANYDNGVQGFCNISGSVRGTIISKPTNNCGGEIIVEYSGTDECGRALAAVRCTIPVLPPPVATITCPSFTSLSCVDAVALTDSDLPVANYDNGVQGFCNISGSVRGTIISKPSSNCGGEIIVEYSGTDACGRALAAVRCTIPVLPPPVATITCPSFTSLSCVDAVALTDSDLPVANYDNGVQGFCNISGTVRGTIISKPSSNCGGEIIVEYSGTDACGRALAAVRCTIPVLPPPVATITCPVFTSLSCVDAVALRDSDLPVANYNNGVLGFCNISGTVRGTIISKPSSNCGGEIIVEYSGLDECDRPLVPVRCTIPVLPPPLPVIECPIFTSLSCVDAVALTNADLPLANFDNGIPGFCNISGTVRGTIVSKPTTNCGGFIIIEYAGNDGCALDNNEGRPLVPVRCTIPVLPPPVATITCPSFTSLSCVDAVALTNADLPVANYDNGVQGFCNISGTVRGTIISKPSSNCGGEIIVEYSGTDECGRALAAVRCTIPVLPPPVATITCPSFTSLSCVDAVALRDSDLPVANYDNGVQGFCNISGSVRGTIISKPSSNCGGEIIVEYSGTDECGRALAAVRCTIPVLPPPVATITCPSFTSLSCVDAVALTDSDLPVANYDNGVQGFCNISGSVRGTIISKPSSNCGGEIIVEYSGTDECGRALAAVRCTIPVLPPPVATITCPSFTSLSCVDAVALTDSDLPVANYDNGVQGFCNISGTVRGTIISKPSSNCGGEIIVEYSGTDECGRTLAAVRCTIPVLPPPVATITCPSFTSLSCVDAVALTNADLPVANYDNGVQGFCNISGSVRGTIISKPSSNCGGEIIVEYSGTDECGRALAAVRCTIPVLPPPVATITCPSFTSLSCVDAVALTNADLPVANYDNGVQGFCNISGSVRGTIISKPSSNCGGEIIVEYSGFDECGRALAAVRCTIPVLPPPVATITCPSFTSLSCVDAVALTDSDLPVANYDNGVQGFCNISGTVRGTIISKPNSNCGGEIIVEYSGTDACGRTLAAVRCTIPVLPPPVATITCPSFTSLSCVDAVALTNADLPVANYDNGVQGFCNISGSVRGTIISKPSSNCGGEIIVEYSGTDACGRTLAAVRCTIPVLPPPVATITCPSFTSLSCVDAVALTSADLPVANYDNGVQGFCNISGSVRGTIISKPSSNCGGEIIVEYSGTDACGRTLAAVRCTIPVLPPPVATITCPSFTSLSCVDAVALRDSDLPVANYDNGVQGFCNISGSVRGTIISKPSSNCGGEIIVEYSGTDECGRALAAVRCTIPVLPPPVATITCPSFTSLSCVDAVALRDSDLPVANYNNGVQGFCNVSGTVRGTIISKPSSNCGGEIIVEYSGTDACGRTLAAVRCTIPVLPPPVATITCPSFTSLSCVDAVALTNADLPVANYDNGVQGFCNISGTVRGTIISKPSNNCGGEIIVEYSGTDECGRRLATVRCTIPVLPPPTATITCPVLPATINCDVASSFIVPNATYSNGLSGFCSISGTVSGSVIQLSSDPCNGILVIEYRGNDNCGRPLTPVQCTIRIVDPVPPVINCPPNVTISCDASTDPDVNFQLGKANASDNCDPSVDISYSDVRSSTDNNECSIYTYTITRTWRAEDECDNVSTCVQIITVRDNTPPVIVCPPNVTVECLDQTDPSNTGFATASDNCDPDPDVMYTDNFDPVNSCPTVITRTWTASDACGNMASCIQRITIANDGPSITCPPLSLRLECGDPLNQLLIANWLNNVSASSSCGLSVSIDNNYNEISFINGCSPGTGTKEVTFVATDQCGRVATCTAIIIIEDTIDPVWDINPQDLTLECSDPALNLKVQQWIDNHGNGSASDDCSSVSYRSDFRGFDRNCDGETEVTFTAEDECQNTATRKATLRILDSTDPVILGVEPDVVLNCVEDDYLFSDPTVSDNCDTDIGLVITDSGVLDGCNGGTITRTWTSTDECGNIATEQQSITVLPDTESPTFNFDPQDKVIDCGDPAIFDQPTASDNCDTNVDVQVQTTGDLNDCNSNAAITRTWTATDNCGNTAVVRQTIRRLRDTEDPVFTSSVQDATIDCGSSIPAVPNVTATDNCDPSVDIQLEELVGVDGCAGGLILTRTWTATDDCGNTATLVQRIYRTADNEDPTFNTVVQDVTIDCGDNIPASPLVTASDNCDNSVNVDLNEVSSVNGCAGGLALTRTWTATDDCGNTATLVQRIYRTADNEDPTFNTIVQDATIDCGDNIPAAPVVTASDNCDNAVKVELSEVPSIDGCAGGLALTRTWTATDDCGNTATLVQRIYRTADNEDPTFNTVVQDVTIDCGDNIPTAPFVTASDNCDNSVKVELSEVPSIDGCAGGLALTRTWTATDDCGNTATLVQRIYRTADDEDPTFNTVVQDVTIDCGDNIPTAPFVTANDNCDNAVKVELSEVPSIDGCAGGLALTRTWTATDDCGNTATLVQRIYRAADDEDPTFNTVVQDVTIDCGDFVPVAPFVTASDNCDNAVNVSLSEVPGVDGCAGGLALTRTWTAADDCGNTATLVQRIYRTADTQDPYFDGLVPDQVISCGDAVIWGTPAAADNCDPSVAISFEDSQAAGPCPGYLVLTRTWTATDDCGNKASVSAKITITDNEGPVARNIPQDLTLECGDNVPDFDPDFVDNCDNDLTLSMISGVFTGDCVDGFERTWTAVDDCGNASSVSQRVTFVDTKAPVFNQTPADIVLSEGQSIPGVPTVTATDICDGQVDVTFTETSRPGCDIYIERTWKATDDCGNSVRHTQTIVGSRGLSITLSSEDATCNQANGSATVSVNNGLAPFQILWNTGATSTSIVNLSSGIYSVTVVDDTGCEARSSIVVGQDNELPDVDATGGTISCNSQSIALSLITNGTLVEWSGPNGFTSSDLSPVVSIAGNYFATVVGSNGCTNIDIAVVDFDQSVPSVTSNGGEISCNNPTVELTFSSNGNFVSWSGPEGFFTTTDESPLVGKAGTYVVTVIGNNGCTSTSSAVVIDNADRPTVNASVDGIITCDDPCVMLIASSNGTIVEWVGPNGFRSTDISVEVCEPGLYTITVRGLNGCESSDSVEVGEDTDRPNVSAQGGKLTCVNTSVVLQVLTNGTVVRWTGPNGYESTQTSPVVTAPGTYTVTVKGANECTSTATAIVTEDISAALQVVLEWKEDASCAFGNIGSATVEVTGGTAPYSYVWNDPAQSTGATAINLAAGTYTVIVTDANGCSGSLVVTIDELQDCTAALGDFVWEDMDRNGIQAINEFGIPGVTVILYQNNVEIERTTTADNGMYMFSGLKPGAYVVGFETPDEFIITFTDRGGNDNLDSDINMITGRSPVIDLGIGESNKTIDAGFYKTAALGDYVWMDDNANGIQDDNESGIPGVKVDLLTDNGIFISSTTTDGLGNYGFVNLAPGKYRIRVNAPEGYGATIQNAGTSDFKDSDISQATLTSDVIMLMSGDRNYSVDAGLSGLIDLELIKTVDKTVVQQGESVQFTIKVNNRSDFDATGVEVTDRVPNGYTLMSNISNGGVMIGNTIVWSNMSIAAGGQVILYFDAKVTGGNPLNLDFKNVAEVTKANQRDVDSTPDNDDGDQSEDDEDFAIVTISACEVSLSISSTQTDCNATNGSATVVASGGLAPYSYEWSNDLNTSSITGLGAGTYTVEVTDANGCTVSASIAVEVIDSDLSVMVEASQDESCELNDGLVKVRALGGQAPYTYKWSNGASTQLIDGLTRGIYTCGYN